MSRGLEASECAPYEAIQIELRQPRGWSVPALHNVSKEIHILAVAFYRGVSP